MATGKNKLKILINNISWKSEYKYDGRKCNSDQKQNYNK